MRFFLCGQTGNINRGCEAIIRSTVKVLNQKNGDIYVATYAPEWDRSMARELGITLISYAGYPSRLHRYASVVARRINRKSLAGMQYIQAPLMKRISRSDLCLTIGGDTYCYGRPIGNIAFNKYTTKKKISNILWCCSIEKDSINDEILEDLKRYEYIFARESITYDNLISVGIDKKKIIKCCDPAFFLDKKEVPLPEGFIPGNTVGINVSEMVINKDNLCVFQNVVRLIEYILNNTEMQICLIPHVYSISKSLNDYPILKRIKELIGSSRISIVEEEYNCEQLKFIISNCRFFVGARTHSTIAAYSSEVPTLVLGYSIKSKGIATDLFGKYDGYVLPYNEMIGENDLVEAFLNIFYNEESIREKLKSFLPEYKASLSCAVEKLLTIDKYGQDTEICDKFQCTGCFACKSVCPKKCISIVEANDGFKYPEVNTQECIKCGKCRSVCPVRNKYKDDNTIPKTYAAINKNQNEKMKSSSGGIFPLLGQYILKENGVVYGAAFDENMKLKHIRIETEKDLPKLQGSKYIQSDMSGIYSLVNEDLSQGRTILFTGTPCQISGLYAALQEPTDNLYTQDIVCHGVPSPAVWEKYIEYQEKCAKSKVKKVSFRDKRTGWKKYSVTIEFENGVEYSKPLTEDYYMRGFLSHIYHRDSCTECSFKCIHRQADVTLADFWGVEKILPDMNDDTGISLIMINSEKGKRLIEVIKNRMDMREVQYEIATAENQSIRVSVKSNKLKKDFFDDMRSMDFDRLIERYCGLGIISKVRRKYAQIFK